MSSQLTITQAQMPLAPMRPGEGTAAGEESERWYALQVRPRYEKKAAEELARKGVATFLPVWRQRHRWSDRWKTVEVPMFPGYAFVRMARPPEERVRILRTAGVMALVGNHGQGTPIPAKQIEDVEAVITNHVSCATHPFLRVGQRVRVRGGCLDGLEGILVEYESERRLVVAVEVIERAIAVRVLGYDVEPIGPGVKSGQ